LKEGAITFNERNAKRDRSLLYIANKNVDTAYRTALEIDFLLSQVRRKRASFKKVRPSDYY